MLSSLHVSAPAPHPCHFLRRNKPNINILSLSRVFLFGARDVWFEVPLPFFLRDAASGLGWSRSLTGAFLAVSGCVCPLRRSCCCCRRCSPRHAVLFFRRQLQ